MAPIAASNDPSIITQMASGLFPPGPNSSQFPRHPRIGDQQQGFLSRLAGGANKFAEELLMPTNPLSRLGAFIGAASGSDLGRASMMAMEDQRKQQAAQSDQALQQAQIGDLLRKASEPRIEQIGGMLGIVDRGNGAFKPTFTAPTDAERYAASLGVKPDSENWATTIQDYILRSSGPTAYGYDVDLENTRQDNREELEGQRQRNRLSLRGSPTYRQANPLPRTSGGVIGGIPKPRSASALPVMNSREEAMRLPPGTRFRTPDGKVKVRP